MTRFFVLVFALALAALDARPLQAADEKNEKADDPRLIKTFTATNPLKLDDTVAAFVIELIHKNTAGVQDQYRKLTAGTEEAAGGRYETRPFQGIEWFVTESNFHMSDKGFEASGDMIHLARLQLIAGYHGGFGVPVNVVGKVHVETSHSD